MANELQYYGKLNQTGKTVVARVYNAAGAQVGADVATTESAAAPGVYIGNMPATAPLGAYGVRFFEDALLLGQGEIYWDGTKEAFPITLTSAEIVAAMQAVADDFKADVTSLATQVSVDAIPTTDSVADLTPVINAISALDDVTAAQLVAAMQAVADDFKANTTALATQISVDAIPTTDSVADLTPVLLALSAIPTTDSVADLTPVINAISALDDVSVVEIVTALQTVAGDFQDKNTEAEMHGFLDTYANKTDYHSPGGGATAAEVVTAMQGVANDFKADTTPLATQTNQTQTLNLVNLILKYHDNRTIFLAADNVTEVPQAQAFFMVVFDDDDTTRLKTIAFRNALGQPAVITEATRYVKQ